MMMMMIATPLSALSTLLSVAYGSATSPVRTVMMPGAGHALTPCARCELVVPRFD
jgi:hypothetical protein